MKLLRSLPPRFKVDVRIRPGTHASEIAVNKQVTFIPSSHFVFASAESIAFMVYTTEYTVYSTAP